jgi:hypothetical protein
VIFAFVVRHFRWLSRLPLAPQLFDAFLLAWTALFHRSRLHAMEQLEAHALQLPGVKSCRHRFGGTGFARNGLEFAHLHGNGLLDVQLTREQATRLIASGRALPHHVFGSSMWISYWLRSDDDLQNAIALLKEGVAVHPE